MQCWLCMKIEVDIMNAIRDTGKGCATNKLLLRSFLFGAEILRRQDIALLLVPA